MKRNLREKESKQEQKRLCLKSIPNLEKNVISLIKSDNRFFFILQEIEIPLVINELLYASVHIPFSLKISCLISQELYFVQHLKN